MLGRSTVEPEHLLLAFSRRWQVRDLLGERGVAARDLHAAIVRSDGEGDELVLGRLPRSRAAEEVLQRAVAVAAQRGERRPDAVHVLLALADDGRVQAILDDLGLHDLPELVNAKHPPRGAPLSDAQVRAELVRASMTEESRPLRAPVPAFERFTPDARRAVRSRRRVSTETARLAGRRLRSHGAAKRSRSAAGPGPAPAAPSRAAAYSWAAASPVSTPSK